MNNDQKRFLEYKDNNDITLFYSTIRIFLECRDGYLAFGEQPFTLLSLKKVELTYDLI